MIKSVPRLISFSLRTLSSARVVPIPSILDFGCIDAGPLIVVRRLTLQNMGTKSTHFHIDLTKQNKQLIIEPKRGFLEPNRKIELRVELICNQEGPFQQEVWVKCEVPFRFQVICTAIKPILEAYHPNATTDFTLIDFPRTYYGAKVVQSMVIKNVSSEKTMYCVVGLLKTDTMVNDFVFELISASC